MTRERGALVVAALFTGLGPRAFCRFGNNHKNLRDDQCYGFVMDEAVITQVDQLMKWDAPKRKQTVFGAKLGRLIVTNARVVFLSSGSNDLTLGKAVAGGMGHHTAALRSSSTSNLDGAAMANAGSLDIPLSAITTAEVKGKVFKTLAICFSTDGGDRFATFAPKNGSLIGADGLVATIEKAKADLAAMNDGL